MADLTADARSLVEVAVDAHTDLNKLAVGLQAAHADPQAVAALQRMAVILGEVVKVLSSGPVGAGGQHGEAQPAPGPAEAQPAPGGPPAAAAPQGGPPQGPMPGARPNGLHEAAANLQAQLAQNHAAAQRALAGPRNQ